jgi:DNA-binding NarL/FixJ family response regulator
VNSLRYALVVDDHPVVGRGIKQFLEAHALLDEVFTVKDAHECLETIERLGPPTIAVIDFWLTEGTCHELIKTLLLNRPDMAILVISGDSNPEIQNTVRRLGVRGFINKQASTEQFSQAILAILSGMVWFELSPIEKSGYSHSRDVPISPVELGLSVRQGQIFDLILQGLPNKKIAQILDLSESTVKEHITGILHKLGVSNRVEAITRLRGAN